MPMVARLQLAPTSGNGGAAVERFTHTGSRMCGTATAPHRTAPHHSVADGGRAEASGMPLSEDDERRLPPIILPEEAPG